jgi:hypothetical protein
MYFFVEFREWPMLSAMTYQYGTHQNFMDDDGFQPGRRIALDHNTEQLLYLFLDGESQMVHVQDHDRGGIITDRADRTFFIAARFLHPLLNQLEDEDRSTVLNGEELEEIPEGEEALALSWPWPWNMQPEE